MKRVETIFPLDTDLKYNQTLFFSIVVEELIKCKKKPSAQTSIENVKNSAIEWKDAYKTLNYLTAFLGEIEQRKMYTLMCLTPEKLSKLPAGALVKALTQLESITDKIKTEVKYLERKNGVSTTNKKSSLSEDEKERINKALKK